MIETVAEINVEVSQSFSHWESRRWFGSVSSKVFQYTRTHTHVVSLAVFYTFLFSYLHYAGRITWRWRSWDGVSANIILNMLQHEFQYIHLFVSFHLYNLVVVLVFSFIYFRAYDGSSAVCPEKKSLSLYRSLLLYRNCRRKAARVFQAEHVRCFHSTFF